MGLQREVNKLWAAGRKQGGGAARIRLGLCVEERGGAGRQYFPFPFGTILHAGVMFSFLLPQHWLEFPDVGQATSSGFVPLKQRVHLEGYFFLSCPTLFFMPHSAVPPVYFPPTIGTVKGSNNFEVQDDTHIATLCWDTHSGLFSILFWRDALDGPLVEVPLPMCGLMLVVLSTKIQSGLCCVFCLPVRAQGSLDATLVMEPCLCSTRHGLLDRKWLLE